MDFKKGSTYTRNDIHTLYHGSPVPDTGTGNWTSGYVRIKDELRIKRALSINPDINFARYEINFGLIDATGVLPPKPLGRHRLIP
ncbi:MAG: hypothetical protein BZY82_03885 [SAR202 cluster bacterium Io17-Chloro-G3]|nr:MAG: hypothetical protein BZY82_03885 [SAR202 cluster bacterium Io17-Chloro-G3]